MELAGSIFFIVGFFTGGLMIWLLRQSEVNTIKKGQDQLKEAFNNLSNKFNLNSNIRSSLL